MNRPYAQALLSSLLVLCLLTAPLCSARCAAQACALSNPSGSSAACHESSDTSDQAGAKVLAAKAECTNAEILFTETRHENLPTVSKYFSPVSHAHLSGASRSTNDISTSEGRGDIIAPHPATPSSVVPLRI